MFNRSRNVSTILIKFMVYQDSQPQTIFAPKAHGLQVEMLLLKIFSLKQKIKNFQLLNFSSPRKQPHVLSDFKNSLKLGPRIQVDKRLQWRHVKQKLFRQIYDIFMHIQTY